MYEVAIQKRDMKTRRVMVLESKAEAIKTARQLATMRDDAIVWVHVFSLATDLSVVSFQSLT